MCYYLTLASSECESRSCEVSLTHYSRTTSFTRSSLRSGVTWTSWEAVVTGGAVIGTTT